MSQQAPALVYDAQSVSRILGLPVSCDDPVPEAREGEVVLYYGGWDLPTLRNCTAGKQRMRQDQNWYDALGWKAKSGYYRLLLPVPGSNRKNWNEQVNLIAIDEAWQPAPVTVAATALLAHLAETGNDLLQNDWCRCAEPLPDGDRAVLTVDDGRVYVYDFYWDDDRDGSVWLSAARES